jgi:hypothetical protein
VPWNQGQGHWALWRLGCLLQETSSGHIGWV